MNTASLLQVREEAVEMAERKCAEEKCGGNCSKVLSFLPVNMSGNWLVVFEICVTLLLALPAVATTIRAGIDVAGLVREERAFREANGVARESYVTLVLKYLYRLMRHVILHVRNA